MFLTYMEGIFIIVKRKEKLLRLETVKIEEYQRR
jgi:hypothetical protein